MYIIETYTWLKPTVENNASSASVSKTSKLGFGLLLAVASVVVALLCLLKVYYIQRGLQVNQPMHL